MAVRKRNAPASSGHGPVRVPKTAELVAARLRRQIVRGEIEEGDALPPESELMREFGVSRPTLREAFRILESEALLSVTRGSRGGARVHPPDIRVAARYAGLILQHSGTTLEDVQAARAIIEPPAARMLAERRNRRAVEALREFVERERDVVDDPPAFADLTTDFHEFLVELAGNQTLVLLVGILHDIIDTQVHSAVTSPQGIEKAASRRKAIRSHEKLVDLIEAGDAEGAERHWREHIVVAGRMVLDSEERKAVVDLFE